MAGVREAASTRLKHFDMQQTDDLIFYQLVSLAGIEHTGPIVQNESFFFSLSLSARTKLEQVEEEISWEILSDTLFVLFGYLEFLVTQRIPGSALLRNDGTTFILGGKTLENKCVCRKKQKKLLLHSIL